jgi:hypothetical protein
VEVVYNIRGDIMSVSGYDPIGDNRSIRPSSIRRASSVTHPPKRMLKPRR